MKYDSEHKRNRKCLKRKMIDFRKIFYCKAEGNYTRVYLENGSFIESRILKNFESGLPAGIFFRIHRSFLINTQCIISLNENSVTLTTNIELQVARRKKQDFLRVLSKNNLIVK